MLGLLWPHWHAYHADVMVGWHADTIGRKLAFAADVMHAAADIIGGWHLQT